MGAQPARRRRHAEFDTLPLDPRRSRLSATAPDSLGDGFSGHLAPQVSHHFSHHPGVTGWTSRLRDRSCFQLLGTTRYGQKRPFSFSQAECRRFEPDIPLHRKYRQLLRIGGSLEAPKGAASGVLWQGCNKRSAGRGCDGLPIASRGACVAENQAIDLGPQIVGREVAVAAATSLPPVGPRCRCSREGLRTRSFRNAGARAGSPIRETSLSRWAPPIRILGRRYSATRSLPAWAGSGRLPRALLSRSFRRCTR